MLDAQRVGRPGAEAIEYPTSDGKPMAENTLQFQWIVTVKEGLEALFADDPNVFVAGDLLWYPVEGDNRTRAAPDALVVFGRPKGYRGAYLQWREENIPPQVVFEILSPGNTPLEMTRKFGFYERFGVEEYYLYDPFSNELSGWLRQGQHLAEIDEMDGWISPRTQIRFDLGGDELAIYRPDGERFLTYVELARQRDAAQRQAEQERERAEQERERAEAEYRRAERLAERLRELGVDPDEIGQEEGT